MRPFLCEAMKMPSLQKLYLRINDKKYHTLKNLLEGYDNLGIISKLQGQQPVVLLRYPAGCEAEIFALLASLSKTLRKVEDINL